MKPIYRVSIQTGAREGSSHTLAIRGLPITVQRSATKILMQSCQDHFLRINVTSSNFPWFYVVLVQLLQKVFFGLAATTGFFEPAATRSFLSQLLHDVFELAATNKFMMI
jgi:hypothetical protein